MATDNIKRRIEKLETMIGDQEQVMVDEWPEPPVLSSDPIVAARQYKDYAQAKPRRRPATPEERQRMVEQQRAEQLIVPENATAEEAAEARKRWAEFAYRSLMDRT
jgi:hypothetical protein